MFERQLHRMQPRFHLSTQNICQKSLYSVLPSSRYRIYDRISAWIFASSWRALSRVLRVEQQPLRLQQWQTERVPCNLAGENRENRKVKMKLQVVKESGVATFSRRIHPIYMCYVHSQGGKATSETRTM